MPTSAPGLEIVLAHGLPHPVGVRHQPLVAQPGTDPAMAGRPELLADRRSTNECGKIGAGALTATGLQT
jgi:hypothetical protein